MVRNMNFSAFLMADARFTYMDSIVIVALFFIVMGLYRNHHPKDEKGRKQRRNFILGVVCVLLYALGRIVLILYG
jgi:hypothetical protein